MSSLSSIHPRYAFYTNNQIKKMQTYIEEVRAQENSHFKLTGSYKVPRKPSEIRRIQRAQEAVNLAVHPDTGELIPWAMRLPSYIILNIPISFGMIVAAPTPFNTVLWQWINQSLNAACNYGNRNASSSYSVDDLIQSYSIAVTSSIGIALFLRKAASRWTRNMRGANLFAANSVSSVAAGAAAGYLNAYVMRQSEMKNGIDVFNAADPTAPVGIKSKIAAEIAVSQTANTRVHQNWTTMLPSLVFLMLERGRLMPKAFWPLMMVQTGVFIGELYLAIPLGVAFYTQTVTISADQLEEEFRTIVDSCGLPVK